MMENKNGRLVETFFYLLPLVDPIWSSKLSSIGAIDTGELIFIAYSRTFNPFCILYYDPKRNNVRVVKFEGTSYGEFTRGRNEVYVTHKFFPSHIENFMSLKGVSHSVDILQDSYEDPIPIPYLFVEDDGKEK